MNKIKNPFAFRNLNEAKKYVNNLPNDLLVIFNELILTKEKNFSKFFELLVENIKINILDNNNLEKDSYKKMLLLTNKYGRTIHYFFNLESKNNDVLHFNIKYKNIIELRRIAYSNLNKLYKLDEIDHVLSKGLVNKILLLGNVMINFSNSCLLEVFNENKTNKIEKLPMALIGAKDSDGSWNYKACINRLKSQLVFNIKGDCGDDLNNEIKNLKIKSNSKDENLIFDYIYRKANKKDLSNEK